MKAVRAVTLLYHDLVGADPDASGFPGGGPARYKISEAEFVRHLAALAAARPEGPVLVVHDLLALRRKSGRPPFLLTFDDGGSSALLAADLLAARGWRAHFFITAGRIGTAGFLDSSGVRSLRRAGHVVGSHSYSHPDPMSGCSRGVLREEWGRSRRELEDVLGEEVATASIPGGAYSSAVARAAAAEGYRALFTSEPVLRGGAVAGCRLLGRFTVARGVSAEAAASLAAGRLTPRLAQFLGWNARKTLKRVGGTHYLRLRRALLDARLARSGRPPSGAS